MLKRNGWKMGCVVSVVWFVTALAASAQTLRTLHHFDYTDGAVPYPGLIQATNGELYGMTYSGGPNGGGTVFKTTPEGMLTTLQTFDVTNGNNPYSSLVQATNGNFYGTDQEGGANNYGTVFEITPTGTLTTLVSFDVSDGNSPFGWLIQATNGNFYGTTYEGGANGDGTVFKMTPSGTLTTLHNFDYSDGDLLYSGLIQATNGNFYGTTGGGGANNCTFDGCGTVFEMIPDGKLTTLHSFCGEPNCADGDYPFAGLVQASDGNFYGTTYSGANGSCADGCGTVFKITPTGALTTLYTFNGFDGGNPGAGRLIQATDGNLYGTTTMGGPNGYGTIFRITLSGMLTTLHYFDATDGAYPVEGLVQDTNGDLYGTTLGGGIYPDVCPTGCGTIFTLSLGLGQFVKTLPAAGKVGAEVGILGTNLTGASSVTFDGIAAQFTVSSPSLILTHVPAGASTGVIKVTVSGETLASNVPFYVLP